MGNIAVFLTKALNKAQGEILKHSVFLPFTYEPRLPVRRRALGGGQFIS